MNIDRYGVVGHPVAHSWSPFIHALFARDTGQAMSYRLFDFAPVEFEQRVREFFADGGRGLNITTPHKVAAAALATRVTTRAGQAGAVNTLAAQRDGTLLGDNTDGAGLIRDLCDNLGAVVTRRRVLIIGAGGATRGVLAPLLTLEPAKLVVTNRTAERAVSMASAFSELGPVTGSGFDTLDGAPFDLVINATSASLSGEHPQVPSTVVGTETVCYDMAYGKTATAFMRWAEAAGCGQAYQGWGMLVEQAAESFRVWRGIKPATATVMAALKERALGS